MAAKRDSQARGRPATTPEGRENQLIALATDLAETQMREGTASSQIIHHFLKAGSTREQIELERIRNENLLLTAKTSAIANAERMETLYAKAIRAMRTYQGQELDEDEYYDE